MHKCLITVVKRTISPDLIELYLNDNYRNRGFGPCELFNEGQQFLVENANTMPPGFCAWAWVDIHRELVAVMSGGDLEWMKEKGTALTCCTDGFRPVIFKLTRLEEEFSQP
ncbi:MAG: TIGR04076 family protein [Candidatus Cloacimonetes bacterium]|nr:TIGR04076 family protein [Candidatus Cloacimonadota bacterium]